MPRVEAAFQTWYEEGGSLRAVEANVTAICNDFEPKAREIINGAWRGLDTDLLRILRDHLRDFLHVHEIARDVSRYVPESLGAVSLTGVDGGTSDRIAGELGGLAAAMTAIAAGIGTVVVAAVHLHLLVLLAVAHPILALVAGISTLGAWLGLGSVVGTAVEDAIRDHEFNSVSRNMLYLVLSGDKLAKKLAEGRAAAGEALKQKILKCLKGVGGQDGIGAAAARAFDAMIAQASADLGVLEELARVSRPEARDVPVS